MDPLEGVEVTLLCYFVGRPRVIVVKGISRKYFCEVRTLLKVPYEKQLFHSQMCFVVLEKAQLSACA